MYIDYHSHILPFIDDGAASLEESITILKQSKSQGVDLILATPHFYPQDALNIDLYLQNRQNAYEQLQTTLSAESPDSVPDILMGAEVFLTPETASLEGLEKLCIEGTNLILIELPFQFWSNWEFQAIFQILSERNLQPIIAHLDRYIAMNKQNIAPLLNMEVYIQVNADSVCNFFAFRKIKKWYYENTPLLLGSDAHNTTDRKTHYGKALKKIQRTFGDIFFQETEHLTQILTQKN